MKTEYKVGMWVTFKPTVGSYGVITEVLENRLTIRWLDEFYTEGELMYYFINPPNEYLDNVSMISILPPVIAAFYENC